MLATTGLLASQVVTPVSRESVRLDGRWRARLDPTDSGLAENWQRHDDAAFDRQLEVPLAWQAADPSLRQYAGAVWYRCTFQVPSAWRTADTELAVRFNAVDYRAEVWINDTYVGAHEGGYTPFELDITQAVERGVENTLTLRAFDPTDLAEIPHGKQGGGWYTRVSGPWQSVWLLARPAQRILAVRCFPRVHPT
jgi:beta-galactosidase/beta-glucuronidase